MKILLLGEYSGLHLNLRDGLRELGHDVVLASAGDGVTMAGVPQLWLCGTRQTSLPVVGSSATMSR